MDDGIATLRNVFFDEILPIGFGDTSVSRCPVDSTTSDPNYYCVIHGNGSFYVFDVR